MKNDKIGKKIWLGGKVCEIVDGDGIFDKKGNENPCDSAIFHPYEAYSLGVFSPYYVISSSDINDSNILKSKEI